MLLGCVRITFLHQRHAENALAALCDVSSLAALVGRDGVVRTIFGNDLRFRRRCFD